ncbi:hypothetical protein A2U01_0114336, partial [Trifolium medium]|nr:hypothetical protein [Trifolium medium]
RGTGETHQWQNNQLANPGDQWRAPSPGETRLSPSEDHDPRLATQDHRLATTHRMVLCLAV